MYKRQVKAHISFPNRTPPAVLTEKATSPRTIMLIVSTLKNVSELAVAPTVTPMKIVTMFMSSFCAVLELSLIHI